MIVKNEEHNLPVCLDSVKDIVDEIAIVDTGSTDRTREIARKYTVKVYDFRWIDDFSAARNYAFSRATCDYVMWLDADDVFLPEDRERLIKLKAELEAEQPDAVMMRYAYARDPEGNPTLIFFRERIVKRSRNYHWCEPVHEYIDIANGKTKISDVIVTHLRQESAQSGRNLKIFRSQLAEGKELSPRGTFYFARELKDNRLYEDAAVYFEKFLIENKGWLEDNINASLELAACYLTLKDEKKALASLYRSFIYDLPRPEVCCKLGYCYKGSKDYKKAVYWFERAIRPAQADPAVRIGFTLPECAGYIPAIECAVCYDALGEREKAVTYNELAGEYKSGDKAVEYNRTYFASKKPETNTK